MLVTSFTNKPVDLSKKGQIGHDAEAATLAEQSVEKSARMTEEDEFKELHKISEAQDFQKLIYESATKINEESLDEYRCSGMNITDSYARSEAQSDRCRLLRCVCIQIF